MAIVKMSQFHLYLMNEQVPDVLKQFQIYGDIDFYDLSKFENDEFKTPVTSFDFEHNRYLQDHIRTVLESIEKYEKKSNVKKNKKDTSIVSISYDDLLKRIQTIDIESILDIYDDDFASSKAVVQGYEQFEPWGVRHVDLDKLIDMQQQKIIIGTISEKDKKSFEGDLKKVGIVYYLCKMLKDRVIYTIISPKANKEKINIILEKYDFENRSANSLKIKNDVLKMKENLENVIDKRQTLKSRFNSSGEVKESLKLYYEYLRNEELAHQTYQKFLRSEHVTIISGWIETHNVAKFEEMCNSIVGSTCYITSEPAPLHSNEVPIKLKNNAFTKSFEMITSMYSQPRYDELDPTPLLAPFYAIFFGMMLADVGYGLLMGIAMLLVMKFVDLKSTMKNMVTFLLVLSIPTILWGLVYGSFFGDLIPIKGLLNINRDFNTVLVMALAFGIFHLFFGLAVKGYIYIRDYKKRYVFYDVIFWYLVLSGAIILVSTMFTNALSAYTSIAMVVMVVGMVGVVLTNGREAKTVPGKIVSGLYSLYGITNYVGDIVSYSRLMALGLAGSSIAMAFNMIVGMLSNAGVFGILFGFVIFLIGHGFNLFISGLSAYVHSARLTYVEFFSKFYNGGGKPYANFRAKPTYIEIQ